MKTLIKQARIAWPGSAFDGQTADVVIDNGTILTVGSSDASPERTIEGRDLIVMPGLVDMKADLADPGYEQRETLSSGAKAAAAGGFTEVLVMPSTLPPRDNKAGVEYLVKSVVGLPARLHPAGCLSEGRKGEQISEMYDMHLSGAKAFTDDKLSLNRAELMHRALDYARNFNGLIISFPHDDTLCPGGQMHEGPVSVSLGMKGIPEITEETRLSRDLEILRYTGGRLHVSLISTAGSVALIRKAKAEGLRVTCGVAAHQLFLTDECLRDFDTRYKVLPPLRTQTHIEALKAGLADGTIDVICSDHSPKEIERKKVEFEHAAFGMSTIETAVATAMTAVEDPALIANTMSVNPRQILGLPLPELKPGAPANLTVLEKSSWTANPATMLSKSKNYPPHGKSFTYRPVATIC